MGYPNGCGCYRGLVAVVGAGSVAAESEAARFLMPPIPMARTALRVAGFCLADVEDVGAVDDDGGEQQRAEEPEVGAAEDGEEQEAVLAH